MSEWYEHRKVVILCIVMFLIGWIWGFICGFALYDVIMPLFDMVRRFGG